MIRASAKVSPAPTRATGATGVTGAKGSAQAYGAVDLDGTVKAARTFNATVGRVGTGTYCITPGPGIDPATVAPQATIDYTGSPTVDALAQFKSSNSECLPTEFEIDTFQIGPSPPKFGDEAFTFLVP